MKSAFLQDYKTPQLSPATEGIPTEEECKSLWLRFGVPDEVAAYSRLVTELARILAVYLKQAGLSFDINLIAAGGYLLCLEDDQLAGSEIGSAILRQINHASSGINGSLHENDLIFLAEHCVAEYGWVSPGGRCGNSIIPHQYQSKNFEKSSSVANAEKIRGRVEGILKLSVSDILRKHKRGILAASVQGARDVYLLAQGAVGVHTDGEYVAALVSPLSPEGVRQAESLREQLLEVPLSNIYCSDMRSAVETARIVADPHPVEPAVRASLRELSLGDRGAWTPSGVDLFYAERIGKDLLHVTPPGGESLMECTARVIPAFYEILNSSPGNMAIVAHPVVNRVILCQVLGISLERLFELNQDRGGFNHIHCEGPEMRLKSINGQVRPLLTN